jgi:hypothetical protein
VLLGRQSFRLSTSMVGRILNHLKRHGCGAARHQKSYVRPAAWCGNTSPLATCSLVIEVHERATSLAAAHFLDTLLERMPFPIAAVQVDGGSEFAAEFKWACQQRNLPLFVLPPRSPKLNGHVERSHRTHHEEFYQVIPDRRTVAHLHLQLRRWEHI